jgi:protein-tyrosine phosphatase
VFTDDLIGKEDRLMRWFQRVLQSESEQGGSSSRVGVLFVCLGNICRSPTAQGVFEHLLAEQGMTDRIHVDSAGTHAYHVGEPPDDRARKAAMNRGIDLSRQRARRLEAGDLQRFHYVLAMDRDNLANIRALMKTTPMGQVGLMMEHSRAWTEKEVPDPYYGGTHGFERVLDMIDDASRGLLAQIRREHGF